MKLLLAWIRAFTGAASILILISACTLQKHPDPNFAKERNDIHERLSAVITRDGFSHGMRSQRDGWKHIDSIYIRIALDSLKRRHYSLDNLMKDIGAVCALPRYRHLNFRIEIGAGDEDDRIYLSAVLAPAIKGKTNIFVATSADVYNDITITVQHPTHGSD